MAKITVIKNGTEDELKVFTHKDDTFKKALLNDERMKEKDGPGGGEVDYNCIQADFNNSPNIPGVSEGNTYQYCIPIKNRTGQIIKWVCGGTGPLTC